MFLQDLSTLDKCPAWIYFYHYWGQQMLGKKFRLVMTLLPTLPLQIILQNVKILDYLLMALFPGLTTAISRFIHFKKDR